MGKKESYRIKVKEKVHFKDYNKTITELCQIFNNLFSVSSKSVLSARKFIRPPPWLGFVTFSVCILQNL